MNSLCYWVASVIYPGVDVTSMQPACTDHAFLLLFSLLSFFKIDIFRAKKHNNHIQLFSAQAYALFLIFSIWILLFR